MKINFLSKFLKYVNNSFAQDCNVVQERVIPRYTELFPQKQKDIIKASIEDLSSTEAKNCNSFSAADSLKFEVAPQEIAKQQYLSKIKAMVNKAFNSESIAEYPNKQVIKELTQISGKGIDVAEKSKNIFLKELGFPKDLVKLQENNDFPFYIGFDGFNGVLYYKKEFLDLNKNEIISYIRHELDHLEYSAELCKSLGIDNYKNMVKNVHPEIQEELFNQNFWEKAIKSVKDISPKETNSRMEAYKKYSSLGDLISYFANPMEQRAYNIQGSVLKSLDEKLGINTKDAILQAKAAAKINNLISKIKTKYPDFKSSTFNDLYSEEINCVQQGHGYYKQGYSNSLILENILTKLEKMYPNAL